MMSLKGGIEKGTLFPGVAIVTGAAGTVIGAAVAKAFAAAGCLRRANTDLNEERLHDTSIAIQERHPGVQVLALAGDISREEFVDGFVAQVVRSFGRIDYGVNCAGVLGATLKSGETSSEEFDRVNGVNYRGCWLTSRTQIRAILEQDLLPSHEEGRQWQRGNVVNIANQLGIVGRPAAIIALTDSNAIDYSDKNIGVNCICPGVIATPVTTADEETMKRLKPAIDIAQMKRMGTVNEVADYALFLSSTKANLLQGVVDGGYVIN